ncbi:MAG: hypothetical protein JO356_08750, partial [Acidobacteria bacterium]|nr:hypothetical protein [Acidobacteriota bacterium]
MSQANSVYKVHFHWERNGKRCSEDKVFYVTAAGSDFSSLQTALANNPAQCMNGQGNGGTMVI